MKVRHTLFQTGFSRTLRLTVLAALLAVLVNVAHAADITVTTTADSGAGSLRQAITDAVTGDRILFNASLVASGSATITLTSVGDYTYGPSALLISAKVLTIEGPTGNNGILISRSTVNMRLFAVDASGTLTLKNITLQNGVATGGAGGATTGDSGAGGGGAGLGGAIFNDGTLTVLGCTLTANTATGGNGGACNSAVIYGAGGGGGGLGGNGGDGFNGSMVNAGGGGGGTQTNGANGASGVGGAGGTSGGGVGGQNTLGGGASFGGGGGGGGFFSNGGAGGVGGGGGGSGHSGTGAAGGFGGGGGANNGTGGFGAGAGASADRGGGGGGAGLGGAIFNNQGATLNVSNSTISGNSAVGGAGGTVSGSSTVVGNAGSGHGGGIFNRNGTVTVLNCTIAANTAQNSAATPTNGGGIYNLADTVGQTATLTLQNNILSDSSANNDVHDNQVLGTATLTASAPNVVESGIGSTGSTPVTSGVISADPALAALASNGGPTQTHAILSSSNACNAGTSSLATAGGLTTDQRGSTRISGASVDLGAFEIVLSPTVSSVTNSYGTTAGGTNVTITGTDFTGVVSVTFDGVSATSIVTVSSTSITCTTPAHAAGAVNVVVTASLGASTGGTSAFVYYTPPAVTSVTPSFGPAAGGTSVTITGTNFSPAIFAAPPQNSTAQVPAVTTVTFGGTAATSVVVVSTTSITCVTPAGTGLVNVVVTNYIGASTGGTGAYTYNDAPTDIALSVSSIAENSASGSSVGTLSATDVNTGDTATFTLVTGTGSTDNASFTISGTTLKTAASFDFETKASYSIRVRVTDSGSLTFEKALTITVTNVNEAPTITSALTATPSSVKTGETLTFTVAASDPENATLTTTYNYGDGSTGTTATHAYTSSGTFTIVATVSDGTNSVTSSTTVTVASADLNNDGQNSPMDTDTDADGFPDAIEKLLGSSPTDATSTPSGTAAPTFGKLTVKAGTYYRSKTGKVTIQFQGILPAPAGLVLNGQTVVIDIGGNSQLFTLNSQGRSKVGATTFKVTRTSPTEASFILHISGSLQENIVKNSPLDGNGRPTLLSLNIYFNSQLLNGVYTLQYKK